MENRKDDLQQMLKEKYESVEVPKEAKERMKMGMEQAKKEKKNKKIVYF